MHLVVPPDLLTSLFFRFYYSIFMTGGDILWILNVCSDIFDAGLNYNKMRTNFWLSHEFHVFHVLLDYVWIPDENEAKAILSAILFRSILSKMRLWDGYVISWLGVSWYGLVWNSQSSFSSLVCNKSFASPSHRGYISFDGILKVGRSLVILHRLLYLH